MTGDVRPDPEAVEWGERPVFALDADLTVYWPEVRPSWEVDQ